jgi:ABC-2 type transport system ATP-binding protein
MRAKLALICALSFHPKLLVCDEPFSGLDPLARDEFMEILLGHRGETTLLMSSHELGEIEAMATDVGFIDRGRLLFQESMAGLAARVREVSVSKEGEPVLPPQLPPEWLNVKVTDRAVSFIETRFDEAGFESKIAAALSPVRKIEVRPVGLRSIFTTIARSVRNEAVT